MPPLISNQGPNDTVDKKEQGHLEFTLPLIDVAYLLYSMGFMAILPGYAGVLPAAGTVEYIKRQVILVIEPWLNQA